MSGIFIYKLACSHFLTFSKSFLEAFQVCCGKSQICCTPGATSTTPQIKTAVVMDSITPATYVFLFLKMSLIMGSRAEPCEPLSDLLSCRWGLAAFVVDLEGVESTNVLVRMMVLSLSSGLSEGPAFPPCLQQQPDCGRMKFQHSQTRTNVRILQCRVSGFF